MITRDLPTNTQACRYFELRAHSYRKILHGRDFIFEYPIFCTDLLGPQSETGLFISTRDDSEIDAYIFIDQQTLKVMMDQEEDDSDIPADRIIDFANRNISMMKKLVLDLNTTGRNQDDFVAEIDSAEVTTSKGRTIRIYPVPDCRIRQHRSIKLTQTCSCINIFRFAVDFLLRRGRFHLRQLAFTSASAFPSTGSRRGNSRRYALQHNSQD